MATVEIEELLGRLDHLQGSAPQWSARCPHHEDRNNSLSIAMGEKAPVLHCHAGCDWKDILRDLGMGPGDQLGPTPVGERAKKPDAGRQPNAAELDELAEYLRACNRRLEGDSDLAEDARAYVQRRFGLAGDEAVTIGLGVDGGSSTSGSRPAFLGNFGGRGARLVIPMRDPGGRPQSCQGRALGQTGRATRWMSPIGRPGGRDAEEVRWTRLGFFAMSSPDPVIVCEGMSDPLTAVGAGYAAVGIRGATLARSQLLLDELAAGLVGRKVVIAADVDTAGADFADRLARGLVEAGIEVAALEVPAAHEDLTGWHEALGHQAFTVALEQGIAEARRIEPPPPAEPPVGRSEETDDGRRRLPCTDLGNARRFVAAWGHDVRYVPAWGQWLLWDGRRWRRDGTGEVVRRAKQAAEAIYVEWLTEEAEGHRKELNKWWRTSQHERRLAAMLTVASTEPGIPIEPIELDADPWLLNCLNGTVDLRSGELRPHRKEDHLTKLAPVEFNGEAALELWDRFLEQSTDGDDELVTFLQRMAGYCLTGLTSEEVLFFIHGPAASGKSTFLDAMRAALGEYASVADFDTFLVQAHAGGPRNDIARLAGARMVVSIEVDEGKRLAEGLVKSLTGGDTVTARMLYREAFEFKPAFKLVLAANHAPRVRHSDEAMWRRILRLPFEHVVPKERRDPEVKATLKDPRRAGAAVLAWAVRGCIDWRQHGLGVPRSVEIATEDYRAQQDPLKDFLEERCVLRDDVWVPKDELYAEYLEWAREAGLRRPMSKRAVADMLIEKGYAPDVRRRVRGELKRLWSGIALADQALQQQMDDFAYGEESSETSVTDGTASQNRDTEAGVTHPRGSDFSTVSQEDEAVTSGDDPESGERDAVTQESDPFTGAHAGARAHPRRGATSAEERHNVTASHPEGGELDPENGWTHYDESVGACVMCGQPARQLDPDGRPRHFGCETIDELEEDGDG